MTTRNSLLLALAFAIAACSGTTPKAQGISKTIHVAAQQVPCVGVSPMMCLQVRERADQPWQLEYSGIEGFEFHPGIEYRLLITEIRVDNPPADGSSVRWVLKEILNKRTVESPAAPKH